jgi:hypothetical protein
MEKMQKRKKILVTSLLSVFALTSFSSSVTLAEGDFDTIQAPSIVTSAYQAAQQNIAKKDADKASAENKKQETEKADDKSSEDKDKAKENSESKSKDSKESKENLNKNLTKIMSSGNFGTVGILFGPTSPVAFNNYAALQNTMSLDKAGITSLDTNSGGNGKAVAYHQFGLAIQKLQDESLDKDASVITVEDDARSMTKVATAFSNVGFKILREYNPSPVLLSFYDSSYLTNANYAGAGGNKLIQLVNQNEPLRSFIKFFGDPGQFGFSRAVTIAMLFGFGSILAGLVQMVWNGRTLSYKIRRFIVRIVVATLLFPVAVFAFSEGVQQITDYKMNAEKNRDNSIVRRNLNLLDWYQNTSFGIPVGTSLTVKNGEFVLSEDDIYNINKYAAKNAITGEGNDDDKVLAARIVSIAKNANNRTLVTFHPAYSVSNEGGKAQRLPWETGKIIKFSESFANNTKIADDIDIGNIEYFKGSLQMSNNGDTTTYTMRKGGYGISPLAAYNLLNTSFNENGFSVRSNTNPSQMVGVGINAIKFSGGADGKKEKNDGKKQKGQGSTAPGIVLFFVALRLVFTGIKGVSDVFITTFGAVFKGGAKAALGTSYGLAMLFGGFVAVFAGLLGVSIMVDFCINLIDPVYGIVKDLGTKVVGSEGLMDAMKNAPFPLNWIAKIITDGVVGLIISIMAIFFVPQLLIAPLSAYINWIKGIPNSLAERAQRWENQFINSHGGPGGRPVGTSSSNTTNVGGNTMMNNAMKEAKATGTGLAMMGAALGGYLGGKIAGEGKHGGATEETVADEVNGKEGQENNGEEQNPKDPSTENLQDNLNTEQEEQEVTDDELKDPVEVPYEEVDLGNGQKALKAAQKLPPISEELKGKDGVNGKEGKEQKENLEGKKEINEPVSEHIENKDDFTKLEQDNSTELNQDENTQNDVVEDVDQNQDEKLFNKQGDEFNDSDQSRKDTVANKFNEANKTDIKEDITNKDNLDVNGVENTKLNNVTKDDTNLNLEGDSTKVNSQVNENLSGTQQDSISENVKNVENTTVNDDNNDSSSQSTPNVGEAVVAGGVVSGISQFTRGKLSDVKERATKTVKNDQGKEMSAIRLATGRGLMVMSDNANKNNKNYGKKYDTRKQFLAGMTHAVGGLTGTQDHTQKVYNKVKGVDPKKQQQGQQRQNTVYEDNYQPTRLRDTKRKAKKSKKSVAKTRAKTTFGSNRTVNTKKSETISSFSRKNLGKDFKE